MYFSSVYFLLKLAVTPLHMRVWVLNISSVDFWTVNAVSNIILTNNFLVNLAPTSYIWKGYAQSFLGESVFNYTL